ncbi:F-box protein CPR1-like [Silene latifolia]|uniref:F-box protein CPR1-like n=1 Tax=Silene latifolia TaxID=37657 RepID=UPI003D773DEC
MSSLPKDIIIHEIISKLPVKSLLRFKCVSKSFYALISSSELADIHVRESRSSDENRHLILAGKDCRNLYSIDIDSPDSVTTIPLPRTPDESKPRDIIIVGSIDGLICVGLRGGGGTFPTSKHVLINPSTRVFREIPYKRTPKVPFFGYISVSFGFGFDDLNRDFKLVRITDVHDAKGPLGTVIKLREVIVYSLNENTWKLVEIVKNRIDEIFMARPNGLRERQNGILVKNHLLHWVFLVSNNYYRIGCFDTRSDNWTRDVPLPKELCKACNKFVMRSLGVINGCLCLSTATPLLEEVWMMKDYETKESWVKLFHITDQFDYSCFYQFTQPFFCFRRESKDEVLGTNMNGKGLFWYDIGPITYGKKEKIKKIPDFFEGCFFTGSLVEIPGGCHISRDKLNDLFYECY